MILLRNLLCVLVFVLPIILKAEERVWTRASDGKTIRAHFVSQDKDAGKVTLKLKNGKEVSLQVDVLVGADQEWLKNLDEPENKEEEKPKTTGETVKHTTPGAKVGTWEVYYPAGLASEDRAKSPLCVLYSPNGRMDQLMKAMKPSADKLGWILVGVEAYSNNRVQKEYEATLRDSELVFKDISKKIPHDKKKVIFGGFSGGAWWSYVSTAEIHNKAAGVVAFGGWMSKQYNRNYARRLKVIIINGDKDPTCEWEEPDGNFLRKKKRATVKVIHFPGKHVIAPADVTTEGVEWLHKEAGF